MSSLFGGNVSKVYSTNGLGDPINSSPNDAGDTTVNVGKTNSNSASTGSNSFPIQQKVYDHRTRLNIKPNDLSKLVSSQDQKDGANASFSNEYVLGSRNDTSNILHPLFSTNGILFPYLPDVQITYVANYEPMNFTHSNYPQQSYKYSDISAFSVTATFTAQTMEEARYTIAAMHFFRTVTKMYFANPVGKVGAPPPTLVFNHMGDMYHDVPVVVTSFTPTSINDVNLVTVDYGKYQISIPVQCTYTIQLSTQYNPYNIKKDFDLDKFRTGKLLKRGYI